MLLDDMKDILKVIPSELGSNIYTNKKLKSKQKSKANVTQPGKQTTDIHTFLARNKDGNQRMVQNLQQTNLSSAEIIVIKGRDLQNLQIDTNQGPDDSSTLSSDLVPTRIQELVDF